MRLSIFLAALLALPLICSEAFALEGGSYQTPDSWSKHFTFGGTKYKSGAKDLGGGATIDASVTSRTAYRSFEDSLTEEYAYLRLKLDGVKVGSGIVSGTFYGRGAYSSEDFEGNNDFSPVKNSHFAERGDDSHSLRLYQANVKVEDVIPNTTLTAGRFYLDHIDTTHTDGADANVKIIDGVLDVHAFYTLPVSYYYSSSDTALYGGGVDIKPLDIIRIRGDYAGYKDDDYNTGVIKGRLDTKISDIGSAYLNYRLIESVSDIELGAAFDFQPFASFLGGTTIFASARTITDFYDEETVTYIDAYSTSLGQEGKNTILKGELVQGITDWLAVSVGADGKLISGDASAAHREYSHVFGSIDLVGIGDPNLYIQLNGDTWLAPEDGSLKEESTFQAGGQITYAAEEFDIWAGASFQKYYYYIPTRLTGGYNVIIRKSFEEDARSVYAGGEYKFTGAGITVGIDLSLTTSSVYDFASDKFNDKSDILAQLNLNWAL
jgi:hypothetical protein